MPERSTNIDYFDLGRRVKGLRRQQNMTQEELAEKLEISASFLGHIERGTRIASLETFVALCDVLDATPNHLLAGSTSAVWQQLPSDMPDSTRRQLASLLQFAYNLIENHTK